VDHIARLAALVGKSVTEFLGEEDWKPRREFIPTKEGIILGPPSEGFDLWGVEIPKAPEPEIEPEAQPEETIEEQINQSNE
jgi:hypothetical protein